MRTLRNGFGLSLVAFWAIGIAGCSGDGDGFGFGPPGGSGNTFALTSANRLVSFSRTAPSVTGGVAITGLQSGENLLGIDVRPLDGLLYGLGSTGRLYTINTTTGAATLKSTLSADTTDATAPFTALDGTDFGVDFNPVVDRLRVVSNTGQNLRIAVDAGAVITDGALNTGAVVRTGITGAAYTNSFSAACRTALSFIDSTTNRLVSTADPNAGTSTDVGNLGVDPDTVNGYEIATGSDGSNAAYAVFTVGGTPGFYTIALTTGAVNLVSTITGLNSGETIRGIAMSPPGNAPAQAPGTVAGVTDSGRLITFNNASPQKLCTTAAISGLQASESVLGIDTRPLDGALYALGSSGRVYTLNLSTAAATLKSTLAPATGDAFTALSGSDFGVDFNPIPDRLRVVSSNGQNLRINVDTGDVITDSPLNPAGLSVTASAYTNSFVGAGTTTLYGLDTVNDQLVIQGQPPSNPNLGVLTPVGPLGVGDVQAIAGFEISGVNNMALAAVTIGAATTSELHMLNLTTGASTRVNSIAGGERVRGLALVPPAPVVATVFGVTLDNQLVSFKPLTPGTFDTTVALTGLQGGESIVDLDFRPANGRFYALTDAGRLYTINPATGAATAAAALIADGLDTTNPFVSLTGTTSAIDFNPTVDRLRVVTDAAQNLRINVDLGTVTTDGDLNGTLVPPRIVANAYTQNFAGSTITRLLDIDPVTGAVFLQSPPNDGALTALGVLDSLQTFAAINGFDIVGGDDGLSLAALLPMGGTQSVLYRVSPLTGAATAIGPIGAGGTLRALAIRLQ